MKILLHGPYGGFNLGDDAIADVLASRLEQAGAEVFFSSPVSQATRYLGRKTLPAPNLRAGRLGTLRNLREFDAVVIGGGEQISEPRVPNPIWGHLATATHLTLAARVHGVPAAWFAVGVDDHISILGRAMIRFAGARLRYASVRDKASLARLSNMVEKVTLGADPVFLEDATPRRPSNENVAASFDISGDPGGIVLIIPTNDRFHSLDYLNVLRSVSNRMAGLGMRIYYAVSDLQPEYDIRIMRENLLPTSSRQSWVPPGYDWQCLRGMIAAASCVISSRMHPLIAAVNSGVPFYCIARSAKMVSLMSELDWTWWSRIDRLEPDVMCRFVELHARSPKSVHTAPANAAQIRLRAARQFDELLHALAGPM